MFNLSFMSGTFPESMKVSKVTPLCKKGDIHDLSNYRPISLLSTFSKILERLMYNRLSTCLHKHSIIFFRNGLGFENVIQQNQLYFLHPKFCTNFMKKNR